MSWQAQSWAIEMGKRFELDPGHRWMLMILANYADPEGNDIYPSLDTLTADTGFSESSIRRHIKHLIACGLMEYGDQSAASKLRPGYRPKVYRLTMVDKPKPVRSEGCQSEGSQSEGSQIGHLRGVRRGVTVTPKPINQKDKPKRAHVPDPVCTQCDRSRPADSLSESGICSDCLGLGGHAAAEGAAFREQLRLKRMTRGFGAMAQ